MSRQQPLSPRALTLALLIAGCAETAPVSTSPGGAPPRPTLDEEDLLSFVPAEADLVLIADMAKLRESPWTRDSFARVASSNADADAGIDQLRDVDRVVFAKVPSLQDGATVLVAQGKVDQERMRKSFVGSLRSVDTSIYRGADLLSRGEESLAFIGQRTVLSGMTVAVRAAIDCNFGVSRTLDAESWFQSLRRDLARGKNGTTGVANLYVKLQPATREALMRDMGEGEGLEEFGGRIDLGQDLDIMAIGVLRTETLARDLAGRLVEHLRDARSRPIVAAFGLTVVLDSLHLAPRDSRVEASVHLSQRDRDEISARMALVADTLAKMRKPRADENPRP